MYDGGYGRRGIIVQPPVGEKRIFNWVNEYCIPLAQAATVGIIVGYTVLISPIIAVLSAGEAAFWLFTGIWMFTTFWWYLRRSGNLVTEDGQPIVEQYDDEIYNTLSWLEVAAGCGMSLMAGGIVFCFHKVLEQIDPTRPEWSTGWIALVGIAQFPMFVVFSIFLLTSFGQELLQRSPHQEMFVWKAIGTLIESFGNKAVQAWGRDPIIIRGRDNGPTPGVQVVQRTSGMTPEQRQAAMMQEFIARGAEVGFSRRQWVGNGGQSLDLVGRKMSDTEYRQMVGVLKDAGLLDVSNNGTRLTCSVEEAIARVIA